MICSQYSFFTNFDSSSLWALPHYQDIGRFLKKKGHKFPQMIYLFLWEWHVNLWC